MNYQFATHFEDALKDINKFITLKAPNRAAAAQDYEEIRNFMINEMCGVDAVFMKLYNGLQLAGSYADNTKISKPNEYDLIVKLKIADFKDIVVTNSEDYRGFVTLNMKKVLANIKGLVHMRDVAKHLETLTDSNGFLLQNKLNSWIESIITRVLINGDNIRRNNKIYTLKYVKTGPAHTLYITQGRREFSIDLVFGIPFLPSYCWPAEKQFPSYAKCTREWTAIPKPLKNCSISCKLFQTAFSEFELDLCKDQQTFKNTLRMLKKIRDRYNISNLKSYFIKTVYMWAFERNNSGYWNQPNCTVLMDMFENLLKYIRSQNLQFFWYPSQNLLYKLNKNQIRKMYEQLKSCYEDLRRAAACGNMRKVYEIFLDADEMHSLTCGQTKQETTENNCTIS